MPHPFARERGQRLYRTGDVARYRATGDIDYLGRSDHQEKVRGVRIEQGEIEAALAAHPAIRQAVVDPRAAAAGDTRLIAWYVGRDDADIPANDLRQHLKRMLPDTMIPAQFVAVTALPMTPNGKVDRKALIEPGHERSASLPYEAPRTDWEATLVRLWQDVLKIPRIGIHDHFFEMGGDSIRAIQMVSRANQAGLRLSPKQLVQYPTIASLAGVAQVALPTQTEPAAASDFPLAGLDDDQLGKVAKLLAAARMR